MQFILSKHGDPRRKEMQVLELLAIPSLSNTFLSLPCPCHCPALYYPSVLWWMVGQGDTRTFGHIMDGWMERNFLRCVHEKKRAEHTHVQSDIYFDYYIRRLTYYY